MGVVTVTILVPVLDRPHRVGPLLASIDASVSGEQHVDVSTLFLASLHDEAEIAELRRRRAWHVVVPWEPGPGDYSKKTNYGAKMTDSEFLMTAADDLVFHPGWLRAALNEHIRSGALVIGTNDLANPTVIRGLYATHLLVHRSYLDRAVVDEPGNLFCEKYDHCCCDTELVETARHNKTFSAARDSHVQHLHPTWKGAPDDWVYQKGRKNHARDRQLFYSRRRLWGGRVAGRRVQAVGDRPQPVARWPRR